MKKADILHRLISKAIDLILVGILSRLFVPFGLFAGALYILISDGFFKGQSIGKWLTGIRVIYQTSEEKERPCDFRESFIRNLPYGILVILSSLPYIGYLFLFIGFLFVLVETYFIYADDRGVRIGDIYADTTVIDDLSVSS